MINLKKNYLTNGIVLINISGIVCPGKYSICFGLSKLTLSLCMLTLILLYNGSNWQSY